MPLVKPLDKDKNLEVQELALFFNETLGFCPNSVLTMQHRPELAKAFIQLNKAVMENKGRVTSRLKRLMAFVSSQLAGCRYCQAHTIRAAERYGADEKQLHEVWDYSNSDAFSDAEKVALDFAIAASRQPSEVDTELSKRLHRHWDDAEIVELLGVISLFGFLNRWNDSMATELEEGAADSGSKWLAGKGWTEGKHLSD